MDRAVELEDEVAWELLGEWERDGGTGESCQFFFHLRWAFDSIFMGIKADASRFC